MILDGGKTDLLRGVIKLGFNPIDNFDILSVRGNVGNGVTAGEPIKNTSQEEVDNLIKQRSYKAYTSTLEFQIRDDIRKNKRSSLKPALASWHEQKRNM